MKTVLVGYEPAHLTVLQQEVVRLEREGNTVRVIACDLELEWRLAEAGVPFVSSREYRRGERLKNLTTMSEIVKTIRTHHLSRLKYRGVSLEIVLSFWMQVYLQKWLYYGEVIQSALERESPDRLVLCAPQVSSSLKDDVLVAYDNEAPLRSARTLSSLHGVSFEVLGQSAMRTSVISNRISNQIRSVALTLLNTCMSIFARSGDIRILASDYWRQIGPLFDALPQSSLVLYDRSEIKNIPLKTLVRHRMRFMHAPDHLSAEAEANAVEGRGELCAYWQTQKKALRNESWSYHGVNLAEVMTEFVDDVVTHSLQNLVHSIEHQFALLEQVRPHIVLLRASVSAQPHFSILAQVARERGIPAIELQHGVEIPAPESISQVHPVEHVGVYGELLRQEMSRISPGPEYTVVGSLDFDSTYSASALATLTPGEKVLCIAPDIFFSAVYDTYETYEYFSRVAEAVRKVNCFAHIKLRNGTRRYAFYHEAIERAFTGVPHSEAQRGTMLDACQGAKLAISCYSTAVPQILKCGVPVVLAALFEVEEHFITSHFPPYENAGALTIARTQNELEAAVATVIQDKAVWEKHRENTLRFMKEAYAFDGHAAERLATLIKNLV